MSNRNHSSRGFTLIAALLIMVLLSGLAVGLMYLASNEVAMGGNDQEQNLANYGAESGMEQLTANLYTLYQAGTNPSGVAVQALATQYPNAVQIPNMTYTQQITYNQDAQGNPVASGYNPVSSGPNQGLIAQIIPMTLQVTATRNAIAAGPSNSDGSTAQIGGASINITRRIEVSLIPVFQFGVFCSGDCDWFAGPNFAFGGRVHANGNLFLASGSTLEFNDKIQAAGEIILDRLENNWPTNTNYQGNILVPNAAGGCPQPAAFVPAANCIRINEGYNQLGDASWSGGFAPKFGAANAGFAAVAAAYNGFYLNGKTGANVLSLPFVQSNNNTPVDQEQIVRKPLAGEVAGASNLSNSRLYNKAAIRILMADNIADLHPERGAGALADGQDIQLNLYGGSQLSQGPYAGKYMYRAMGKVAAPWAAAPIGFLPAATAPWSLLGQANNSSPNNGPWLRVEYLNTANPPKYVGVTQEWLNYGFGRTYNVPPTGPAGTAGQNPISPAILILQQLQNGKGVASAVSNTAPNPGAPWNDPTSYNWTPINFHDAREGEPRDYNGFVRAGAPASCNPIGVMNAVELDVGNLWLWLQGLAPYAAGTGKNVNSQAQNGYVLYFSDHRGMRVDPNTTGGGAPPVVPANTISGVSGLEDTINSGNATGTPDGLPEPAVFYTFSPEDLDGNGKLDAWGEVNLGYGFGINTLPANVYADTIGNCAATGLVNLVTGARHALRLVDGGMSAANVSYVPGSVAAPATSGFTVASEEPVYVYGNYNTGPADPLWANPSNPNAQHAAAAIIADAVTLLSNQWLDSDSLNFPALVNCNAANGPIERCGGWTGAANNPAYYRMAIASGKTIPFPNPGFALGNAQDFGTDGGMHNFLRYLEDMGKISINYTGSMVSLYYSQYATGVFKCCGMVYNPPSPRNYNFDTLFLNPANLPPGTPAFQDIVNLSYHQNFAPQ
jgi:type II secretory pathway pseudopilin PulG